MTRQQMGKYRDQLRAMAARLGGTVAGLVEGVRRPTGGESAGGLSNAPLHLGDVGTDVFNQELDATLLENEAFIRDEVLAALDRIDRGTYGRCENCKRDIVAERREALPYTRYCTSCAAQLQAGRAVNVNDGRPGDPGTRPADHHAAGTPGGGTAVGGLAGTNVGEGAPEGVKLEAAMGSASFDVDIEGQEGDEAPEAYSGPAGGAVGGTPANKRSRGGKRIDDPAGGIRPRTEP